MDNDRRWAGHTSARPSGIGFSPHDSFLLSFTYSYVLDLIWFLISSYGIPEYSFLELQPWRRGHEKATLIGKSGS